MPTSGRDIVLFYPSTGIDVAGSTISLPLALLYPASLPHAHGYPVQIIDQRVDPDWRQHLTTALQRQPLCLGVTAMTGAQIGHGLEASRLARSLTRAPIVWGGVHASLLPEQTASDPDVDIVVVGEGERTFFELVQALEHGTPLHDIPGLCFKQDGKALLTPSRAFERLDELPDLPYELVDVRQYFAESYIRGRTLSVVTGRGCPHLCGFCYNRAFNKSTFRKRGAHQIVEAIRELVAFGAENVFFCDDIFFSDKRRAEDFCHALLDSGLQVGILTNCRIDYLDRYDDDFLRLLKKCRFYLSIGVETGSARMLELIRKGITIDQVHRVNAKLARVGLDFNYTFMGGFPTETWADINQTVDLMLQVRRDNPRALTTPLKVFTPLPGTELYDLAMEHGFKPPQTLQGWARYSHNLANFQWGSPRDVQLLERISWFTCFLDEQQMQILFGKNPLLRGAISAYARVARLRCQHHAYRFTPEVAVMRAVYGRLYQG